MSANLEELVDRYPMTVFWSDEDDAYIAVCPAFPGHSAFGDTPESAIRDGRVAPEGLIESFLEHGDRLPKPGAAAT